MRCITSVVETLVLSTARRRWLVGTVDAMVTRRAADESVPQISHMNRFLVDLEALGAERSMICSVVDPLPVGVIAEHEVARSDC